MGYRSDVAISLVSREVPEFEDILCKHNIHPDERYQRDGYVQYYWKEIKWYQSKPGVDAIESFLFTDRDPGQQEYAMIRLGEEVEDIEEYGDTGEFGMRIERTIMF